MVGIVVVSHSDALAEGVVRLAREMANPELVMEAAGGMSEPGVLGTDAERVRAAIDRAMSPDGVLVLMDLGSALISAELAVELLERASGPVLLSDAPLVEGTAAAAVAASGGASLEEVASEARGALAMKVAQIGAGVDAGATQPSNGPAQAADVTAELPVRNPLGLHARPAARLVTTVRGFDAEVRVSKAGTSTPPVSARSLTNLVALGVRRGDTLLLSVSGTETDQALTALRALADSGFGDGLGAASSPAASSRSSAPAVPVPPAASAPTATAPTATATRPTPGTVLTGEPASTGIVVGQAQLLGGGPAGPPPERPLAPPDAELAALQKALTTVRADVERDRDQLALRVSGSEAEIFEAHLALLEDEALVEPARAAIAAAVSAERAFYDAVERVAGVYRALSDPILAQRAADVLDVGRRVVGALTGAPATAAPASGDVVMIADDLTPSQTAKLDPAQIVAIATARGSFTAHAAIIARSLGIPAVVGIGAGLLTVANGTRLLLDGDAGSLTVEPSQDLVTAALRRQAQHRRRVSLALARSTETGVLASGQRIEIFANIGNPEDAVRAVEFGAEGVGMLRTEFLFLDRSELPDEDEQVATLLEIARTLDGRPLIVRTLDAGADKPLPALPMPGELNPFLGMRGIRVGLLYPDVLRTQLRAVLRVAVDHPVKLMMPMVATLGEVLASRRLIDEARSDLGVDPQLDIGITLEVPAAALMAEQLGRHLDFLSLGTNDLTQYTMAAERGNATLEALLASPQPAVLRLVKLIVEGAATASADHRCWVGVCGEMAGDPACAILLAGLGVTELSMAPSLIPEVKAALRSVHLEDAARAAQLALDACDPASARAAALDLL
jgi:phosphoenolpyruvate-protein phosphotransferase/dihydroxyacetone kinase phosphotransfer subunit